MSAKEHEPAAKISERPSRHRVHIPGFIREEELGLGDAIKRMTYALGIKHCTACQRRARALNHWLVFTR